MTINTDNSVEFELFAQIHCDMTGANRHNGRAYNVAYCPRCQELYTVFADSAIDADEGFGAAIAGNFPRHTSDQCFEYLGQMVEGLKRELENLKNTVDDLIKQRN